MLDCMTGIAMFRRVPHRPEWPYPARGIGYGHKDSKGNSTQCYPLSNLFREYPGGIANGNREGWDILCDDSSRSYYRSFPDGDALEDKSPPADPGVAANANTFYVRS